MIDNLIRTYYINSSIQRFEAKYSECIVSISDWNLYTHFKNIFSNYPYNPSINIKCHF